MADDGDDAFRHQVRCNRNGRVGITAIVPRDELDRPATDTAGRIDLLDGQLGGLSHRRADDRI